MRHFGRWDHKCVCFIPLSCTCVDTILLAAVPQRPKQLLGLSVSGHSDLPTTALIAGIVMTRLGRRRGNVSGCCLLIRGRCRAADIIPTKAPPATVKSSPALCTDAWNFIASKCQLAWQGITVFGTIDAGAGWQSHGAPLDPLSAVSASYLIQKQNNGPLWTLAPNALTNSTIGIKGMEPIGGNISVVFDLDAGFDPYSFRFSNGAGSVAENAGLPQNHQLAWSIRAERASGTMAKVILGSVLRPMAP